MKVTVCPFCGVATGVPHERQELCIAALQAEIALIRQVIERVKLPVPRPAAASTDEPEVRDPT